MDRNLALEVVRVTEAAALQSARMMGRGDEKAADQAAVEAMRRAFDAIRCRGTVVIGEGERDETPMLYIGEDVGCGAPQDPRVDIAVDALEGSTITAKGGPNALSVIAIAEEGKLLRAPDVHMEKIAVGPGAAGAIDLRLSPTENLHRIAAMKGSRVEDLTVMVLDRPRHENLIREVRKTGARIQLISDGDISAAIATCEEKTGIDVLMGIGGAPEGVLAAAALRCVGGEIQGRFVFRSDEERSRARRMVLEDLDRVFNTEELAGGSDVMFAATGVTDGSLLKGVRYFGGGAHTHSVVMRARSGTVRYIESTHFFERKPSY